MRKIYADGILKLALALVKIGALQFGTFFLPDGSKSSYYVNLGTLPSFPSEYNLTIRMMIKAINKKINASSFHSIASIPATGLVYAVPIAISLMKPLIFVRGKSEVDQRRIEGLIRPGWKVLIIDDLVRSGNTISLTAKAIRSEGCEVRDALVLIDRLEGAKERLRDERIRLHSVTNILELSEILYSKELIAEENLNSIKKQVLKH